jgi:hypothetical protein
LATAIVLEQDMRDPQTAGTVNPETALRAVTLMTIAFVRMPMALQAAPAFPDPSQNPHLLERQIEEIRPLPSEGYHGLREPFETTK